MTPHLQPRAFDGGGHEHAPTDDVVKQGDLVLVALSGGPDSLALAAATAFEAERQGLRAGAVIVDHGLQPGSAETAEKAAAKARELGLDPVHVVQVDASEGDAGPEGNAREARYQAFEAVRRSAGAARILLAHTLDDQAETVLLGLARGSGPTSLSGMPVDGGGYLRPFLSLRRQTTVEACDAQTLSPWHDPHNGDPKFARVRVRNEILPLMEDRLGPGIAEALSRTATRLREDADTLDALALEWAQEIVTMAPDGRVSIDVGGLTAQPPALRSRICRLVVASEFGRSLSSTHTKAILGLVDNWHGQKEVNVPGVRVERREGSVLFEALMPSENTDSVAVIPADGDC